MVCLEIGARFDELSRMVDEVERFVADAGIDPATAAKLTVALDEVVTNAIEHGRLSPEAIITVDLGVEPNHITAVISDPGPIFDPLALARDVDVAAPLETRPVGGLGLLLLRGLAQEIAYRRADDRNHLTIRFAKG